MQQSLAVASRAALPDAWDGTMLAARDDAPPLARVHRDEFSRVATTTPCAVYAAAVHPARMDQMVDGQLEALAQKWKDRHVGILHATQPAVDAPPRREMCREAGACVCKGEGRLSQKCLTRLKQAFGSASACVGSKKFDSLADGGALFFKLHWDDIEVVTAMQSQGCSALPHSANTTLIRAHAVRMGRLAMGLLGRMNWGQDGSHPGDRDGRGVSLYNRCSGALHGSALSVHIYRRSWTMAKSKCSVRCSLMSRSCIGNLGAQPFS